MNNMKKFFAFSIATAMVAGAVCAGTPAFQALADETNTYWWDKSAGKYVELNNVPDGDGYVKVHYDDKEGYVQVGESVVPIHDPESQNENDYAVKSIVIHGYDNVNLGHSYQFSADVSYYSDSKETGHDVTWKSLTPAIAKVDEYGLVTPNRLGLARVEATSLDKSKSEVFEFYVYPDELRFKNVDPEKVLTVEVGDTIEFELVAEDAAKYPTDKYKYDWEVWSDSDKSQEEIATVTENGKIIGKITGKAEGQCEVILRIVPISENSDPLSSVVASASYPLEVVSAATKQNATPVDPTAPTSEAQAKQEQTPESIANYQKWLATYGGGTTAAAGTTTVSGTIGQPGSEAIVNTASGAPVAMFQSNDATNTLLAAPVGVVPSGTKIETVEAGKDSATFKAAQNRLSRVSRRGTVQKVYGITALNADGSQITTLNGKAAMSMPLPTDVTVPTGKALKVYLIPDNGQPTKLDTLIDQGRVVFEIPKFGTFAFVVE